MSSKTITLKTAVEKYMEHLEAEGKTERTRYTYLMDLKLALEHFGEDKKLAKLIPAQVAGFFKSDLVTTVPKSGRAKSEITITKTKRVFRQMLVFCRDQQWIETLPLTKDEAAKVKDKTDPKKAEPKQAAKVDSEQPAESAAEGK